VLTKIGEAQQRHAERSSGRRRALADCLDTLPQHVRELVRMRYFDARAPRQIAERVGKEAGAIRIALHRARNTLAQCLQSKLSEGGAA